MGGEVVGEWKWSGCFLQLEEEGEVVRFMEAKLSGVEYSDK